MSIALYGLAGLFAALLINRGADCWLAPAPTACGLTRHPLRSGLVVAGVPALFALVALWGGPRPPVAVLVLVAVLLLLAVVDAEQRRLPNAVVLPGIIAAVLLSPDRAAAMAGGAMGFLLFLGLYLLGRRLYGPGALGAGDVKLAALVGAAVGWPGAGYALLLGIVLAGGAAVWLSLSGRGGRGATLPYGAFLALGGVVALFIALL